MRRNVGVKGIVQKKEQNTQYADLGKQLEDTKLTHVTDLLTKFNTSLSTFAEKHKQQINSDPQFRLEFHKMCKVGINMQSWLLSYSLLSFLVN